MPEVPPVSGTSGLIDAVAASFSDTGALARVVNGLTLSGGAGVTLNSGGFDFAGTQTLAGTGGLVFAGSNASTLRVSSGTLTIQSGIARAVNFTHPARAER